VADDRSDMSRSLLISAAEVSGDAFGASLAREFRALDPDLALFGLGGRRMAASGVDIVADITDTSIVGFFDGLRHTPRYLRANRAIRRALAERAPAAVVAVDAPGFNFPLLRAARKQGIATIYYVCPQTWLWNPHGATARLRAAAGRVVAVLPEEARLYRRAGLATIHHGHPLVDMVGQPDPGGPADRLDSEDGAIPIGLLPGSRHHEIRRLLPLMCDAMNIAAAAMGPIHVRVGLASDRWADALERARRLVGPRVRLTRATAEEALTKSSVSLAASGSVLLEACLLDAPVVMTYRLDRATHWIGYHFLRIHEKLPHYALPNLIARERIIPEIVEGEAVPERLAEAVCRLAQDADARRRMRDGYRRVRAELGSPGVTRAVARDILDLV
jgi:lipid-A-disaccharide synthase